MRGTFFVSSNHFRLSFLYPLLLDNYHINYIIDDKCFGMLFIFKMQTEQMHFTNFGAVKIMNNR
jgi:hypothetical protein